MQEQPQSLNGKVALVTGAARRLGAAIAGALHAAGANLIIHYNTSREEAQRLVETLNSRRPDSALPAQGDLVLTHEHGLLIDQAVSPWGRLDVLVNNASTFFPTPVGSVTEPQWEDLLGSNLKGPFFLSQAAAPHLKAWNGCIVNLADIYADRPLRGYPVYSIAKAGLGMLTKALAVELAPHVRVNAVAPGSILWPEPPFDEVLKGRILASTPLRRQGDPREIARAVVYLARDAGYSTGTVVTVDGGRSLSF